MKLPNGKRAFVDMAKLVDYCLNETHPRGKHKARVFAHALGLRAEEAPQLRRALLNAAREQDALLVGEDEFGQRYRVDFKMTTGAGQATVRSLWIVRGGEDFPRFVSGYVLLSGGHGR